jgi:hypothetical protein
MRQSRLDSELRAMGNSLAFELVDWPGPVHLVAWPAGGVGGPWELGFGQELDHAPRIRVATVDGSPRETLRSMMLSRPSVVLDSTGDLFRDVIRVSEDMSRTTPLSIDASGRVPLWRSRRGIGRTPPGWARLT